MHLSGGLGGACATPDFNGAGAGGEQGGSQAPGTGAGGDNIVDDGNAFTVQGSSAGHRSSQVGLALCGVQFDLGPGGLVSATQAFVYLD
jgi:hypothetical protein